MQKLERLKVLLDKLLIDWREADGGIELVTQSVKITEDEDGLCVNGWGYYGIYRYSAEWIAHVFDRKFCEEMIGRDGASYGR